MLNPYPQQIIADGVRKKLHCHNSSTHLTVNFIYKDEPAFKTKAMDKILIFEVKLTSNYGHLGSICFNQWGQLLLN